MKFILNLPMPNQHACYTDASNVGYGVLYSTHWLFGGFFKDEIITGDKNNIRERELFPILIAANTFGPYWTGTQVIIYIDNSNACNAIINKDIRAESAHQLLVRICESMMKYRFEFRAQPITSNDNYYADALSRLKIKQFKSLCEIHGKYDIDPAPMLHLRPPFEIGRTHHLKFPNVQVEDTPHAH